MKERSWLTLQEVEEAYEILASTLRAYIARGQVIPGEVMEKVGNQWFLHKDWVEKKYKKREKKA